MKKLFNIISISGLLFCFGFLSGCKVHLGVEENNHGYKKVQTLHEEFNADNKTNVIDLTISNSNGSGENVLRDSNLEKVDFDREFVWSGINIEFDESKCDYEQIKRVVDGDTFELQNGQKVRMTGIDTPETSHPTKGIQFYGKQASDKLKDLLENKSVCLIKELKITGDKDKYNRLLRYVWLDGKFVNAAMILNGYSPAYNNFDFLYSDQFLEYEKVAKHNFVGVWNLELKDQYDQGLYKLGDIAKSCGPDTNTICPKYARYNIGKKVTVRMLVKSGYDDGKIILLNSLQSYKGKTNFTVVINDDVRSKFETYDFYKQKVIDVSGTISVHNGKPQILLFDPAQINVLK